MKKPLLILTAMTLAITSCQKSSTNNTIWTCTCKYSFVRPYYSGGLYLVADTTVNSVYASGTSQTAAQLYCNNQELQDIADTFNQNVKCFIQ